MTPVCEASDTAVSCYNEMEHEPVDRNTVLESEFPWQDAQPPVYFGQASLGPYSEVDYSPIGSTTILGVSGAPHALSTSEQDGWYGARQESMMPSALSNPLVQSPSPPEFSHGQLRSLNTYLSLAPPTSISPLPMPQRPLWEHAMGASATNGITSNPQALEAYSDAATNHLTPAMYATVTDQYSTYEPHPRSAQDGFIEDAPLGGFETDYESREKGPCYANLIYQALMEAPGHKMILRDIYAWIAQNTDKAKDPSSKGWQNSVRHNLSMNGVYIPFYMYIYLAVLLTEPRTSKRSKLLIQTKSRRKVSFGFCDHLQSTRVFSPPPGTERSLARSKMSIEMV